MLTIDWDHPVPPKHEPQIGTFAIKKCALPLEQALAIVSGDDPRPLLVVRECARCAGTEDALLSRVEDNERTFLMSRWFHCVKLPPQVTEPDHPFHNLFAGENPEHLFVSRADGSLRRELGRDRSLAGLWKSMRDVLAAEYRDDPGVALTQLAKILDRFDELDGRIFDLQRRIERAGEDEGPSSKQLVKLRGDLAVLNARRDELRADVVRSSKLARREPEPVAANKSG